MARDVLGYPVMRKLIAVVLVVGCGSSGQSIDSGEAPDMGRLPDLVVIPADLAPRPDLTPVDMLSGDLLEPGLPPGSLCRDEGQCSGPERAGSSCAAPSLAEGAPAHGARSGCCVPQLDAGVALCCQMFYRAEDGASCCRCVPGEPFECSRDGYHCKGWPQ